MNGERPLCQDCNNPRDWIMNMGFPVSLCQSCYEISSLRNKYQVQRPPELRSAIRDQVLEFHRAIGQPIGEKPMVPSEERVRLRLKLITEEFIELLDAADISGAGATSLCDLMDLIDALPPKVKWLPDFVDALADLDYVIEGCRIEFGIDGGPIAAEVHRANMTKVGGGKREDGKVMKPDGFKSPDIEGELKKQGWTP